MHLHVEMDFVLFYIMIDNLRCTDIIWLSGQYYPCDNGYTHGKGFVTPYTQTRYHMKAWGSGMEASQNPQEYFNMVHSKERNVIERAFGVLKIRWKILAEESKYPVQDHLPW